MIRGLFGRLVPPRDPDEAPVPVREVQRLEDEVRALRERVRVLEERVDEVGW
jgi:hypothetical protein